MKNQVNQISKTENRGRLLKHYENGTDFDVCVYEMSSGKYVVTVYDFVYRKHEVKGRFDDFNESNIFAKKINNGFKS